jgi:hypothetical protein
MIVEPIGYDFLLTFHGSSGILEKQVVQHQVESNWSLHIIS